MIENKIRLINRALDQNNIKFDRADKKTNVDKRGFHSVGHPPTEEGCERRYDRPNWPYVKNSSGIGSTRGRGGPGRVVHGRIVHVVKSQLGFGMSLTGKLTLSQLTLLGSDV